MGRHPIPQTEIERRTFELLRKFGLTRPPVDVLLIAKEKGIRVEMTDFGADCSGVLVRKDGRAVIGVNWTDPPVRQRFTIAHELAHYDLHGGDTYVDRGQYIVQFRDSSSGSGSKIEEREANQFSAALLMPSSWIREAFLAQPFDLTDDEGLRTLATKFEVSTQAMSYRLGNLRLLEMA
ncbi:MAG: ImmA/IrrE family metallo-endopeptidase [Candidatus Binataceae bacterium]